MNVDITNVNIRNMSNDELNELLEYVERLHTAVCGLLSYRYLHKNKEVNYD